MPITLSTRDAGFEAGFQALLGAKRESAADVDAAVAAIIDDVAARGDAALVDYTRQFDRLELTRGGWQTFSLGPRSVQRSARAFCGAPAWFGHRGKASSPSARGLRKR